MTFVEFSELRLNSKAETLYLTIGIILDLVVKRNFHYYIWDGISPMWRLAIDIYPEVVMEMYYHW